ncbi:MAG: hypothetical protein EXR34_01660 [Rhodoferax sp.]|nr:hypothetical protein [Rhodoferax sp.]
MNQTEARGMALSMDPAKGNCVACHLMNPASGKPEDSPFSEFTFYANGIPGNPAIPKNSDPAFFDLGLCGPERTPPSLPSTVMPSLTIENFCGKFRMPTLRNVAERPAFMHNGFFKDLPTVLRFYSTRNSNPQFWYGQALRELVDEFYDLGARDGPPLRRPPPEREPPGWSTMPPPPPPPREGAGRVRRPPPPGGPGGSLGERIAGAGRHRRSRYQLGLRCRLPL